MATMKDVAERAGVSLSTVSYVLSGSRPISEATRARIQRAMADLDFHPNVVARALASKRTRVLGLVLSARERGLGLSEMEFVRAATEAARAVDHHLVLLTEGMDTEADLAYLKRQGLVDGLLVMEVLLDDPRLPLLRRLGLPFSLLGRPDPALDLPFADIDFDRTFETLLGHLAGLGHTRIALVNQSRDSYEAGNGPVVRAQAAYDRWCQERGLTPRGAFCVPSPRDGWEVCTGLFEGPEAPTALVVMNDRALPGILQALAARGLRVPDDVSVVSAVTSAAAAEMMVPPLSSADAPSGDLARMAVANLIRTIESPHSGLESVLFPCVFTPRASTGPAPHSKERP